MGRPFTMLVGIVSAGDYRAVIVILEHLVVDRSHNVDGGIHLGSQAVDIYRSRFQYCEAEYLFVVVLLLRIALDDCPRGKAFRLTDRPFFALAFVTSK